MTRRLLMLFNAPDFVMLHRAAVVRALHSAGFEVHIVVPQGPRLDEVRDLGAEVHAFSLDRKGTGLGSEADSLGQLARIYRRLRPRVGYHETIKPVIYGSLVARATGVHRRINAISGLGSVFLSSGPRAAALRWVVTAGYRQALSGRRVHVLLQNVDDERDLRSFGALPSGTPVSCFGGAGVDLSQFCAADEPGEQPPLVVLPGRMLADKGVREFVEASRLLRSRGVAVRMALVGGLDPGNPSGLSALQLEQWGSEKVVEWWGHQADMAAVLRQANVVCLPSYREGLPKVLMEAGAVGRAVVATDVPGCRDVLDGGRLGVLVPPRDAVGLASALETLVRDPARRLALARSFQHHAAQHFDERLVAARYVALFESVASS